MTGDVQRWRPGEDEQQKGTHAVSVSAAEPQTQINREAQGEQSRRWARQSPRRGARDTHTAEGRTNGLAAPGRSRPQTWPPSRSLDREAATAHGAVGRETPHSARPRAPILPVGLRDSGAGAAVCVRVPARHLPSLSISTGRLETTTMPPPGSSEEQVTKQGPKAPCPLRSSIHTHNRSR